MPPSGVSTNPLNAGVNPLKTDRELKALLSELPSIQTRSAFNRWRTCFLTRYEHFLGQAGVGEAEPAYQRFCTRLNKFTAILDKVQNDLDQGNLSTSKTSSVSARTRLGNCYKEMGHTTDSLSGLTPATLEVEKSVGYTKFQLGAMLVRNGFAEYNQLADCNEKVTEYYTTNTTMKQVCDRQILDGFDYFSKKFQIFCDIMADLGLYQAMLKCHEINQLPPEPEPEPEPPKPKPVPPKPKPPPPEPEPEESDSSSSDSDSSSSEDSLPVPKPIRKKKEPEPEPNPYREFKMSFPTLKPPSGPFIKFVDTGAKTKDDVKMGIHKRGALESSSSLKYDHDNESSLSGVDGGGGGDDDLKEVLNHQSYTEFQKPAFGIDYHGGAKQDDWRISKGKVPIKGKHKSFQGEGGSDNDDDDEDSVSSSEDKKKAAKKAAAKKEDKKKLVEKIKSSSKKSSKK